MPEDLRERVNIANESMTIIEACQFIGMAIGEFAIQSIKTYCPFGEMLHEDGGRSKAFRVYPGSNSAYCFACGAYYTPVKLIAVDRDIPEPTAAELILEEKGYVAPDYLSRWDALATPKETVDADGLANALKLACARMCPDWDDRQFDEDISDILRKCLAPIVKVTTEEEARTWLDTTKAVMKRALAQPRTTQEES